MRRHVSRYLAVVCFAVLAGRPLSAQNWRPVGPSGGDVRSLAADLNDPRRLYLGTSDGSARTTAANTGNCSAARAIATTPT